MTGLDPANQLAALIRVQVSSLRRRQTAGPELGRRQPATTTPHPPGPDLATVVAQRIRSVARDDPQRERKAFRIFLETVLLSELGQELVSDPTFALMVDHVQSQMESDPDLAKAAGDASRLLLNSADGAD